MPIPMSIHLSDDLSRLRRHQGPRGDVTRVLGGDGAEGREDDVCVGAGGDGRGDEGRSGVREREITLTLLLGE
jgi:hypothetical protein